MLNVWVKKSWLSPVVAVAFVGVAFTGVLMWLNVKNGAVKTLHEWIGLLFAGAGLLHLCLNWSTFLAYLKQRHAVAVLVITLLLTVALLIVGLFRPRPVHNRPEPHPSRVMKVTEN